MNDAEYAEQKARVEALRDTWVKPVGLGWWRWDFAWRRERHAGDETENTSTPFTIDPLWEYGRVKLTAYLPTVAEWDDEELEEAFCHELGHVFACELRPLEITDEYRQHEERVATMIGKAFVWLRDHLQERSA